MEPRSLGNVKGWAESILDEGFTMTPTLFLKHAAGLGLDAVDQMLLVHVMRFARASGLAHPSSSTLAELLGLKDRGTVQRRLRRLERFGCVIIKATLTVAGDPGPNIISIRPLVRKVLERARLEESGGLGASAQRVQAAAPTEVYALEKYASTSGTSLEPRGRTARSTDASNTLLSGLEAWHLKMGSTVAAEDLRGQLASAIRSLGVPAVRELWRQARDADHTYRDAGPGVFWRMYHEARDRRLRTRRGVREAFGGWEGAAAAWEGAMGMEYAAGGGA